MEVAIRSADAGAECAPPELVIFDCDGVLVDSEPISISVLIDLVAAAGFTIDIDAAYERFLGKSMATICQTLRADPGLDLTDAHLDEMRRLLYHRFRTELLPISGVAAALAAIPLKRCVASSSQPERIALSLELTGLSGFFDHIFSATMVANGKPAPDLFLHAARTMDVPPQRCLVIEDSAPGIEAAKRAGMRVFAFSGGSHAHHPPLRHAIATLEPDAVFDNMAELPAMLERMETGKPAI